MDSPCIHLTKVLHDIESMLEDAETNADETNSDESIRVIIIDGMTLVNKVHKDDSMKMWKGNFQLLQSSGINYCKVIV